MAAVGDVPGVAEACAVPVGLVVEVAGAEVDVAGLVVEVAVASSPESPPQAANTATSPNASAAINCRSPGRKPGSLFELNFYLPITAVH